MEGEKRKDSRWHNGYHARYGGQSEGVSTTKRTEGRIGLSNLSCRGDYKLIQCYLLNAAIGKIKGKGADEQTLLRTIQDTFSSGDLVLGDAFYPSYFFIAEMQSRGIDILMEQYSARRNWG